MKIYFASSIRGGRDESDKLAATMIINILNKFGTVLTEHIGDKKLSSQGEDKISNKEIYQRDMEWLYAADLVVAEVSKPSLGVGYEIGISESLGKKIICLYRGGNISAMILGNPNLTTVEYDFTDGEKQISDLIKHLSL